ncbi:hypothetical protein GJ496_009995 [Pomphorhynchus laevis]|nr:hypothetical protein GJ496_009995 [Pomphorhynchus laevis]
MQRRRRTSRASCTTTTTLFSSDCCKWHQAAELCYFTDTAITHTCTTAAAAHLPDLLLQQWLFKVRCQDVYLLHQLDACTSVVVVVAAAYITIRLLVLQSHMKMISASYYYWIVIAVPSLLQYSTHLLHIRCRRLYCVYAPSNHHHH